MFVEEIIPCPVDEYHHTVVEADQIGKMDCEPPQDSVSARYHHCCIHLFSAYAETSPVSFNGKTTYLRSLCQYLKGYNMSLTFKRGFHILTFQKSKFLLIWFWRLATGPEENHE
jgi:hypothetical protein